MNKIDPELARVLIKRIRRAVEDARYYPAESADTEAIAKEIVRPYLERVDNPIGSLPSYHVCPPGTEDLARKAYGLTQGRCDDQPIAVQVAGVGVEVDTGAV